MLKLFTFLLMIILNIGVSAQNHVPRFMEANTAWADSILKTMTLEEKIGQLIMVTAYSQLGESDEKVILSQIAQQKIGGVLFLKSSPHRLAELTRKYQEASMVPLFIAIDAENGLSFRMDSVVEYPHLIGLGAMQSDSMLYIMGREIGRQCKTLGINLNFGPVADVNCNPGNPIISYRSFGESPEKVAQRSWLLAKGMQDENILVTLKHFPGHGDTSFDSHLKMASVEHGYSRLDSIELIPFRYGIKNGINGIMTAHIHMKGIDSTEIPATLSTRIMTNVLRDSLGFQGLVFSDAMNMKGITDKYPENKAAVEALKAGVDVLEFVVKPAETIKTIKEAVSKGILSEELIHAKCRKILIAKWWCGIPQKKTLQTDSLIEKLNLPEYHLTARKLFQKSITVLSNQNNLLPFTRLDTLKVATVALGDTIISPFQRRVDSYVKAVHYNAGKQPTREQIDKLVRELKNYNLVILAVNNTKVSPATRYSLTDQQIDMLDKISKQSNTVFLSFMNPYSFQHLKGLENCKAIVLTYHDNALLQDLSVQQLFGAIPGSGKLPVTINQQYKVGDGINTSTIQRLQYSIPEDAGFDSGLLKSKIDSFCDAGIDLRIFPGCHVLVAKDGKVIWNQSYGYHTYDKTFAVQENQLYDLASLTKILGPLPLLMQLVEDSTILLDKPFSEYWKDFRDSNKSKITLREILAHQAQLRPGANYAPMIFKRKNKLDPAMVRNKPSETFTIRVSSQWYARSDMPKRIYDLIKESDLLPQKKYSYSDMGFVIFPELISQITGTLYEERLKNEIFRPIGAYNLTYNPANAYPISECVPTEMDENFRKELLQGYVHDEVSSLIGGVSGHAGLFGTSNDLAKIMQMYLQKGKYGGIQYINESTVNEFTRTQFPLNENRRALGFDKPYLRNNTFTADKTFPAKSASESSFGHTGFTGTFAWCDPRNNLLFIFLSNRVYPTRQNTQLITSNFRPKLHESIYQCTGTFAPLTYTEYRTPPRWK